MLAWMVWGNKSGFAWLVHVWLLINVVKLGIKFRVGSEKLFYQICENCNNMEERKRLKQCAI